ncbi:MAG: AmpG family muropeptide MFS transporter [Bdellovibrionales bacterium]|nr:AmpG family muropeptide MFS transporter [Bdellovibrionales bacterium]
MKILQALAKKNMLVALLMGICSGLPLLLAGKTLQAWMTEAGVDLKTIGLFALAGLPYSFKFVWAPLFDRFVPPFLGRRRGWLTVSQAALALSIGGLAMSNPQESAWTVALLAVLVSFFSASQDIVVDAYRRETLRDDELGMGSAYFIYGYRIAMYISGALALFLADHMEWRQVYLIMAATMAGGIAVTLFADEPSIEGAPPRTLKETVVGPLLEFLQRKGALEILIFILLYKVGDSMAGNMATPFYLKLGFSKTEIAAIAKTFGLFSTLGGLFLGGVLILRLGIGRCLWVFGLLQALSTACFAWLSVVGNDPMALALVIAFEDLSGGMGTAAFTAFMAAQTNKRFTATQYALLTSMMAVPRTLISAPTGYLAENLGWTQFFFVCTLAAIPGMLLLLRVAPWKKP